MLEWEFDYGKLASIKKEHHAAVSLLLRDFMDDIADFVEGLFKMHVPVGADTPTRQENYYRVSGRKGGRTLKAVSRGNVEKTKYGYRTSIGIEPITRLKPGEDPNYPKYVEQGTGRWNPFGAHDIVPAHGNIMVFVTAKQGIFFAPGDIVKTQRTKGQPGKDYLDDINKEANAYVKVKKKELAAKIAAVITKG